MLPTPANYSVYPSVVPADTAVELTIAPNEKSFLLFPDVTYVLTLIQVNGDEDWYHAPRNHTTLTAKAEDGILRFTYTFSGEQEHVILLAREGEKPMAELSVYSLYPDLLHLRPLRGDFHTHSYRSDAKRDPSALAGHFREQGYDFFALTDHNRFYPGAEIDETYAGLKMGLARVTGEEVHAPESILHIIHVGGRSSVAGRYVADPEAYAKEVAACAERVPADVPTAYRDRYARAMWTTEKIHAAGGLAIYPHPYWKPGKSRAFHAQDDFARLMLKSGMFDAYELVGGMGQEGINRSIALWGELRAEGVNIPVVGSSDVHGLEKAETFPYLYTICFAEANANDAIIDAVRAGRSVAVEATGIDYACQNRCYGSLRLVGYAHFLLRRYFPQMQRICQGEGVAMRAYAIGEADRALIELQAEQAENFYLRFFGKLAPVLPTTAMREQVARWREIQKAGPSGKGSLVSGTNMQL